MRIPTHRPLSGNRGWESPGGRSTTTRPSSEPGAGIFADELPGGLAEDAAFNSPGFNAFTIRQRHDRSRRARQPFHHRRASQQALLSQFNSGGSFNSISRTVPSFAAPNFYSFPNTFYNPTYYKWNFEVEQALGAKMVTDRQLLRNARQPHSDSRRRAERLLSAFGLPNGFAGLPASPPNAAFGVVTQYLSAGKLKLQRPYCQPAEANFRGIQFQCQLHLEPCARRRFQWRDCQ